MTSTPDRRDIVALIDKSMAAGARQSAACAELGLSERTLQRWTDPEGGVRDDHRPLADRPEPAGKLSEEERDRIVATCNAPEFASLPPSQIVPRLADQGIWIASESSFYRVLRERGQNHRRGRARRATRSKPPTSFEAKAPCQVWSWDITWLPGPISGAFFYLYLIVDIFSRKIVGWEVHDRETAEFAAQVLERAVWAEKSLTSPLALHADNGSPLSCRLCMQCRAMNEGRDHEGHDGAARCDRILQSTARQQRQCLLRSPVPDLQIRAQLAHLRLRDHRRRADLGSRLRALV